MSRSWVLEFVRGGRLEIDYWSLEVAFGMLEFESLSWKLRIGGFGSKGLWIGKKMKGWLPFI